MDGKTLDSLAELVERTEKQKETLRLLATKTWTESEIRDLLANTEGDPNRAPVLGAIMDAVDLAKLEGRYRDDVTATRANVGKRLPAGSWMLTLCEVGALALYAASLDLEESKDRTERLEKAAPLGGDAVKAAWAEGLAKTYAATAKEIIFALSEAGAIVEERHFGQVARDALPAWTQNAVLLMVEIDDAPPEMVKAQAARWTAIESAWRVLLDAARTGEAWPAYQRGGSWEPWSDQFTAPPSYTAMTARAQNQANGYFFRYRKQGEKAATDAAREAFQRRYGDAPPARFLWTFHR